MEKATESASSPNSLAAMFCAQAKRYQDKVLYRFRDLTASQEAIDTAGWLHTGDVGAADGEGFLRVTDRKKDLIVSSGGKKVAPQRLENLLKEDSLISQAVIVGAGKPHLSALITLDRKRVLEQAAEQGVDVDPDHLADPAMGAKSRAADHPKNQQATGAVRSDSQFLGSRQRFHR